MMPASLGGRYRVLAEIARGGMGVVYLVEHSATGRRHAAKVMLAQLGVANAAWGDRFLREVRAPARIDSEHVVEVTDAGAAPELAGMPFLVMELLEGRDLGAVLVERGHLTPAEVVSLVTQLSVVLERAHALGIVHRDLKPSNLFLHRTRDGRTILKVLDFGLATALGDFYDERQLTRSGDIMGTPHYMAPEQARGDRPAMGPASDRFAVGMIAFELLCGQRYWGEASSHQVIAELCAGSWSPPSELVPGLGAAFDAWFARSCHRDPAQRFAGAGEQAAALAPALGVAATHPFELAPTLAIDLRTLQPMVQHAYPAPHASVAPTAPDTQLAGARTTLPQARSDRSSIVWLSVSLALTGALALGAALWIDRDAPASDAEPSTHDETELEAPDQDEEDKPPPPAAAPANRPPGPWAGTSRIQASEYDEEAARRAVEPHLPEVRACYVAALKNDPKLRGELVLMLNIEADGTTGAGLMCAQRPELIYPVELCRCVVGSAKSWRFPPPESDLASIFYGFFLEP